MSGCEKTDLYYGTPYEYRFCVLNVKAIRQTCTDHPPWFYATGDLDDSEPGIAGQNNPDPYLKMFRYHFIVYIDGTWLDPSYGSAASAEQDYTNASVAFLEDAESFTPSRWRKPHVDGYPDASLAFEHPTAW
ncbi:MAG: hypothetical protein AB7Y46_17865 [Armatimonadota bacterium]